MPTSAKNFFTPSFSHIYIEQAAEDYPLTQEILRRFPRAVHIRINRYKEVFARSRQHFALQKRAPQLILAVQQPPFLYRGADVCPNFGQSHFYYTSSALNCMYHCEYCFLQGMLPSANLVLFVNLEDSFAAIEEKRTQHPLYVAISYETDLLALEPLAPFASRWIEFARGKENLLLELRSKSANYPAIAHLPPSKQVILAWTLSPAAVIRQHEPRTPPLNARLNSIRAALVDGWRVRLCFDPILHVQGWRQLYGECIAQSLSALPVEKVEDISIGTFRIPREYLKQMRRQRWDSSLVHYPYVCADGVCQYPEEVAKELITYVTEQVQRFVPAEKIYLS